MITDEKLKRMGACAPLLPDPGPEVVKELLDHAAAAGGRIAELERDLAAANARAEAAERERDEAREEQRAAQESERKLAALASREHEGRLSAEQERDRLQAALLATTGALEAIRDSQGAVYPAEPWASRARAAQAELARVIAVGRAALAAPAPPAPPAEPAPCALPPGVVVLDGATASLPPERVVLRPVEPAPAPDDGAEVLRLREVLRRIARELRGDHPGGSVPSMPRARQVERMAVEALNAEPAPAPDDGPEVLAGEDARVAAQALAGATFILDESEAAPLRRVSCWLERRARAGGAS